jgi:uncharacterized protein (DUF58 family)
MVLPELIPADVRARLKHLRLTSRRVSSAMGIGQQASRLRGSGLEFAQYRAYEPGDEPRQIDWKLYARSDKFFVRESERDSPLTAWVLLDASASMAQCDAARPHWSRLQAAKTQAACVFELACRQGDHFGLIVFYAGRMQVIEAGIGPRHRDRCLLLLANLEAKGAWPLPAELQPVWQRVRANDVALLLSDGFDESAIALIERLALARREVLNIQLLTVEERDFPYLGGRRFVDVESGAELRSDAPAARAQFMHAFSAACTQLARRLAKAGIRHIPYFLDAAPDAPLQQLFAPTKTRAGERA